MFISQMDADNWRVWTAAMVVMVEEDDDTNHKFTLVHNVHDLHPDDDDDDKYDPPDTNN